MTGRKKNIAFWVTGCSIVFIAVVLVSSCRMNARNKKYHHSRVVIGTYVNIDVCSSRRNGPGVSEAMNRVWERFDEIEQRMNAYDMESDIGKINQSAGKAVAVHPDVYTLIQQAADFSKKTEGAFDITVRPLIEMWRRGQKENHVPSAEEIELTRKRIGADKVNFLHEGQGAVFCDGCMIDLGGIAKGYAVDEAARILRDHHFENFLINAGGDMYGGGKNCHGQNWRIGVRDPRNGDRLIDIVEISNQAITTSGDYEQFYEIEGKRFSHIINPLTGYPQQGIVSATVIAPSAVEADVFSTALMVWPATQGMDFINQQGSGYAAFLIEENERDRRYHLSRRYSLNEISEINTDYIHK
jgi:thiamine biosynthesis lipoprotein